LIYQSKKERTENDRNDGHFCFFSHFSRALTEVVPQSEVLLQRLNETFLVRIGNRDSTPLLYNFRLTNIDLLEFCSSSSPHSGSEENPEILVFPHSIYSDSLKAVVLLVDPSLNYNSTTCKGMILSQS
jgi:hypothetical protein